MGAKCDFSGWATKNDLKCSDGRTIRRDAFKDDDGKTIPLVWQHIHNDPDNVLGHAVLFNRPEGVRFHAYFNTSDKAKTAKMLVEHGDITAVSIYANQLKQQGGNVLHGKIRELSLVLAGANPGALIDMPIMHGDEEPDEAFIYTGEGLELSHSDEEEKVEQPVSEPEKPEEIKHSEEEKMAESKEKTVQEVFDTLNEEQKTVVYALLGEALGGGNDDDEDEDEEEEEVKHNVFDTEEDDRTVLSHDAMTAIISNAKQHGSLKEAFEDFIAHEDDEAPYGIEGLEWLFPEDRELNTPPKFIDRDQTWVSVVMGGVHHTPFSRVKSSFANITEDEARAKGYIKKGMKKEEVFSLLKRATSPQTVYKKQKLDRDDKIDIVDFDVVAWIKGEMRGKLNEELARAFLIGDGRLSSDDDKIFEDHIRPIANDADLFTIKKAVVYPQNATDSDKADAFITAAVKARKNYKGAGNPTLFTTEDLLTDMLLMKDGIGRRIYTSESELATALRVSKIVTVPVMENHQVGGKNLLGIIVNLVDYNVGADKGGAVNMFEDFDIDYNQEKYLIETRCSGALVTPYSAIVLFESEVPTSVDGDVVSSKTTQSEDDGE